MAYLLICVSLCVEIHIYDLGSHRQRPSEAFVEIALRSSPEWSLMADLTDKRNKFHKLLPKVIELYGAHVTVTSLLGSKHLSDIT